MSNQPEVLFYNEQSQIYCIIYRNNLSKDLSERLKNDCIKYCINQYPVIINGKEILQPRNTCVFSDPEIKYQQYSGLRHYSIPLTDSIKELCNYISTDKFKANI